MRRLGKTSAFVGLLLAAALCAQTARAEIVLPPPNPGPAGNSLLYGDFFVYSLPFLNNIATGNPQDVNGPFFKRATAGAIKDDVIMGINNLNPQTANLAVMNDPYETPSADNSPTYNNTRYFTTQQIGSPDFPHPGPAEGTAFAGDTADTWNAQLGSLRTQLDLAAGNHVVFFYMMNQTRAQQGGDEAQVFKTDAVEVSVTAADPIFGLTFPVLAEDMLVWKHVSITMPDGTLVDDFFLTADTTQTTGPDVLNPVNTTTGLADSEWVHAHGEITVDNTTGALLEFGANPAIGKVINQNLGENQAAFAMFNPELDALVKSLPANYLMKVDFRYAFNTDGNEHGWLQTTTVIPEPASLLVWSLLGALGVAVGCWRHKRTAA